MQLILTSWAQDGSLPFSGEPMFGDKVPVTKDDLYASLYGESGSPTEDALTIMALELLSSQLLVLLERQVKT
ncbi:hypothetical protein DPMN_037714 [Dreissena polymorpha]|uniref:Uncharacterized protein n=1 Tax=Dreissena polymorpha TaxID=45954 RepID=A0A9D4RN26_DREPO|nr:hypothetical protein DPMN_037714 [Dreissena polymorpha]